MHQAYLFISLYLNNILIYLVKHLRSGTFECMFLPISTEIACIYDSFGDDDYIVEKLEACEKYLNV
jgi:hypothetical protein